MSKVKKSHSGKGAVIYILVAVLCIAALSSFGVGVFFRILYIDVEGAIVHSPDDIISASELEIGSGMFSFNIQDTQLKLREDKPLIYEVTISRVLPNRILIEVYESIPFAKVEHNDGTLIIDSSGRVLEIARTAPSGLIEIRGFEAIAPQEGSILRTDAGEQSRLTHMIDILRAMQSTGIYDRVTFLDVTSIARVFFDFDEIRIDLGAPDNVVHKLSRLENALNDSREPGARGRFDMSHSVIWRFHPD